MNERERFHPETPRPASGPANGSGADLNALRAAGTAMLAAADDVIARVLSGDSQAFNQAARQEGGQ